MSSEKIFEILAASSGKFNQGTAIRYKNETYTYSQAYEEILNLSEKLGELTGNGRIQYPVGLFFKNCPEFVLGYYGLAHNNIVVMLVDHSLKREELLAIVKDCHLGGFLIHREERDIFPLKDLFKPVLEYKNFVLMYNENQDYNRPIQRDRLKGIVSCRFSSGTTGVPKCMMYTQENVMAASGNWSDTIKLTAGDRVLCVANYTHGLAFNTSMLAPLWRGAQIHMMDSLMPRRVAKYIQQEKISIFVAFPVLYQMMSEESLKDLYDLSSLRLCVSSGTVLHAEVKQKFKENVGIRIADLFGIAETGLCILNTTEKLDSVGQAVSDVEAAITDEEGNRLPPGAQGHVAIKSKSMSRGYYNFPGLLEQQVTREGFYISGDIGIMDEEGYVYIKGRKQDFIDVAGKKIDPKEIEEVLLKYKPITDVAVFGKTSSKTKMDVLCAAVISSQDLTRAEIIDFIRERLASYKIPQKIIFPDKLPRNSSGKVLRTKLVEMITDF